MERGVFIKKKILVDLLMIILLLLITNTSITGVLIHEILGIIISIVFIIHLYLNWKSIKIILRKLSTNELNKVIKINLIIDSLLFILFLVIIISGILISKNLFSFMNINYNINVYYIHLYGTYIALGLLLFHIIKHLKIIGVYFKKITGNKNEKKILIYIAIISLLFIYNLFKDEIINLFNKKYDNQTITEDLKDNDDNNSSNSNDDNNADKNNDDDDNTTSDSNNTTEDILIDYLSKLFCNGCHRHCPLSNPQCGVGEVKKEQAIEEYYNESE